MIDRTSLPRIRIKSRQAGLPPKCPGRVRAHLHVTLGPMEWNALNSAKLRDESLYVALAWWGDDEQPVTKLPLSNSRQTTTYFRVTRSMKTLQRKCYLTDMGALTLTLCDGDDNVIGAGSVPGIKRLAKNNPIREMSNIRDGQDGYRLGRLPILINMSDAKSSRSRSTSRSRSNSARRSNSRGRKKASPSPKRTSPVKSVTDQQQLVEPQQQQQRLEQGDLGDINDKISSLLHKSNELFNQMNAMNSATSTMTSLPPPIVPRLNITTSYSDINKENRTPNMPQSSTATTSYATSSFQHTQYRPQQQPAPLPTTATFQHHQHHHQFPSTLGQARNLPHLTLNIPDMPVFNSRVPDIPTMQHGETSKSDYLLPIVANESLNHSMHSVDYVPSETGSLLDQDILESLYTMNLPQARKVSEEPVREEPNHWLRLGDQLTVHVVSVELPQRKGRPPPSTTMRRIDDAFCLDFDIKWADGVNSRFQSSRMKNGLIWFDDEKCFTAASNVLDPLCVSLYHKTKFSNGWQVIDMAPVSTFDQLVTVKLGQYRLKLKMSRQVGQVDTIEKHSVHMIEMQLPEVSAGVEPVRHVNSPEDLHFKMPPVPVVLDIADRSNNFEMSFPVSFVLCVKAASGLPSIKVNGQLEQPLTFLNIRSCLLEEGQLMMRTSERSMSPVFNCAHEWNCSVDASRIELLQASFFAFEMWCATLEQGDQLLGMGRIGTAGLGSILAGGYSLLCSPRYPIVMADGKVPIRELASNQVRGHLEVVLAVGTSVQIDNFKNKRADVSRLVNLQSALENSIIEASLDEEVEEEEIVESEVEIIEEKPEPIGISCLISIDRCSNTNIRQHSKLRVTLDTLNGPVSTDWSGSGNFGFQQCCTFADPLPDKLVFSLQTKYMVESDFANRSVESLRREECVRELGWVEMGLHTLSIGFPQITGWYSIRSLSGESCGQIKLGLSPSIQTPRTAIYMHRTAEPRPLTPPPPQRLEQSNAQLRGQLAGLDELIKTVKAKQTSLNDQRKDLADLATQVTPSLSRVDMTPPKPRTPTPPADDEDDEIIVPNVSARSDSHIRSVPPIDLGQFGTGHSSISLAEHEPGSSEDESSSDELNDIVPINSNQHIHMLSESTNDDPLSSTRVDDEEEEEVEEKEEEEEDSSEQNINKMMDAFQHSCQSARDNLEMFKQLRDETVPDEEEVDDQNATSVWNSTLDEAEKLDDVVERVLDETAESSDHDDTLDEYTKQEFINTVEAMTVTHSIEVESSELDELVSQSAITVDDDIVDDRPGLARLTMEAMNQTDDSSVDSLRIERPDRTAQMTLNPKQTRRLAAIFGLK